MTLGIMTFSKTRLGRKAQGRLTCGKITFNRRISSIIMTFRRMPFIRTTNDNQHNNIQQIDIQCNNIKRNETCQNKIQQKDI
jgi:hypothetical protein